MREFYAPLQLRLGQDYALWRLVMDQRHPIPDSLRVRIENTQTLPNQDSIVALIYRNADVYGDDLHLVAEVDSFVRHATIQRTLRGIGQTRRDAVSEGYPWPNGLLPALLDATNTSPGGVRPVSE